MSDVLAVQIFNLGRNADSNSRVGDHESTHPATSRTAAERGRSLVIVGIVVSALACLVALAVLIYLCARHKRPRRWQVQKINLDTPPMSPRHGARRFRECAILPATTDSDLDLEKAVTPPDNVYLFNLPHDDASPKAITILRPRSNSHSLLSVSDTSGRPQSRRHLPKPPPPSYDSRSLDIERGSLERPRTGSSGRRTLVLHRDSGFRVAPGAFGMSLDMHMVKDHKPIRAGKDVPPLYSPV